MQENKQEVTKIVSYVRNGGKSTRAAFRSEVIVNIWPLIPVPKDCTNRNRDPGQITGEYLALLNAAEVYAPPLNDHISEVKMFSPVGRLFPM